MRDVRRETMVDTGLEYLPGDPVRLRVVTRRFPWVSDQGGAVERAGKPPGWRDAAEQLAGALGVNVSRAGVVSLPVVPAGPGYDVIVGAPYYDHGQTDEGAAFAYRGRPGA